MPKLIVYTVFLVVWGMGNGVLAQAKPSGNSFDEYYKECLTRTSQQKLPADVAQDLCNCTIKTFQQRYSLPQFRELVRKSHSGDRTSRQTLTAVGEACFEQVLYEE